MQFDQVFRPNAGCKVLTSVEVSRQNCLKRPQTFAQEKAILYFLSVCVSVHARYSSENMPAFASGVVVATGYDTANINKRAMVTLDIIEQQIEHVCSCLFIF